MSSVNKQTDKQNQQKEEPVDPEAIINILNELTSALNLTGDIFVNLTKKLQELKDLEEE